MSYHRSNSGPKGITIVFSFLLLSFAIWYTFAEPIQPQKMLKVYGKANIKVKAQRATLQIVAKRKSKYFTSINKVATLHNQFIVDYLSEIGITPAEMTIMPVQINSIFQGENRYEGLYGVKVETKRINLLDSIQQDMTPLLKKGILLVNNPQQFGPFYHLSLTKSLEDKIIKKSLTAAQTKAEDISASAATTLGAINYIEEGLIHIESDNPTVSEIQSPTKRISLQTTVEYQID